MNPLSSSAMNTSTSLDLASPTRKPIMDSCPAIFVGPLPNTTAFCVSCSSKFLSCLYSASLTIACPRTVSKEFELYAFLASITQWYCSPLITISTFLVRVVGRRSGFSLIDLHSGLQMCLQGLHVRHRLQ